MKTRKTSSAPKVGSSAVAFANAFTAKNDDAEEVERTVHVLIAELENAGLRAV